MGSASIRAEGLGLRFLFDRYQRAVTPALARLRRALEQWFAPMARMFHCRG